MLNLKKETLEAIKNSGHQTADIIFIGSEESGHQCTWKQFAKLANRDYDDGYGGAQVASDLIIVFSDGAKMWRGEYDGSEWWEYSSPFKRPAENHPISSLFADVGWDSLSTINSTKE